MAQLTPQFFTKILKVEGEFQNFPTDSGNYCSGKIGVGPRTGTKFGMSTVAVANWWGRCPSEQEMRDLTQADALNFYAWYFDRVNLYPVESQQLFELLANNAMGSPKNAAKRAQRVLNKFGYNVAVDGAFGPQTISALNNAWKQHGAKFYNAIREDWVQYYKDLNRPEFIDGWLKRMKHFPLIPINAAESAAGGAGLVLIAIAVFVGYKIINNRGGNT